MDIKKDLGNLVDNVKDGISEAGHRGTAQAEQERRDVDGANMTTGEKAGSVLNQAKNDLQGDFDQSKRAVRNNT